MHAPALRLMKLRKGSVFDQRILEHTVVRLYSCTVVRLYGCTTVRLYGSSTNPSTLCLTLLPMVLWHMTIRNIGKRVKHSSLKESLGFKPLC